MSAVKCAALFGNFLSKRSEHLDVEILRDWFPADDAWVGHVEPGKFDAFNGVSHTFDRFRMAYPDLSGGWTDVGNDSCSGNPTPCDWDETIIGYGSDRYTYKLQRKSYGSELICWDQNITIDQAVEKWGYYVEGLRDSSKTISSDRLKVEALRGAGTLYLAGAAGDSVAVSLSEDNLTLDTGGETPSSILTLPYLMTFVEELQLEGYFKKKYETEMPMFKLITDLVADRDLKVANSELTENFRFDDFVKGAGQFYRYGASGAVGNFMIAIDKFPMRFVRNADETFTRIFPYENASATLGIKRQVAQAYKNATYQIDFIWHESAMRYLVMDPRPISKDMPFMVRDFGGKWNFGMDNLVFNGCAVDNKRRNKGQFYADFENSIKFERPELVRAILSRRNVNCVIDVEPCTEQVGYPTQDTNSANDPCPTAQLTFTPTPDGGPFDIAANTITCNGVPIVHVAVVNAASVAALASALNSSAAGALGTWDDDGDTLTLDDSTCQAVTITFS